jgi:hypothetical protein
MSETMTPELIAFVKQQKDRQDIWQALLDYTRGVDRHDRSLMERAYHGDSWDDHGMASGTGAEFCDWAIGFHAQIQTAHQHYITNHTVELDGDVAHAETYYIFWGENREGPPTLAFGRYLDRLERRDGRWAIAYRRCIIEKSGHFLDAEIPEELKGMITPTGPVRWDRQDASYVRPLLKDTPNA